MKPKYIRSLVVVIVGAIIGLTLAFFIAGSANANNLFSGALIGGLIGLYLGISAFAPAQDSGPGGQSGMG